MTAIRVHPSRNRRPLPAAIPSSENVAPAKMEQDGHLCQDNHRTPDASKGKQPSLHTAQANYAFSPLPAAASSLYYYG